MEKIVNNTFIKENIAPFSAAGIGVYDSSGKRIAKVTIPESFKPADYGVRLYRFGLISDVHFEDTDSPASIARAAPEDFQNALQYLNNKESVEFTCICGDVTMENTTNELKKYKDTVDAYSPHTPVYTTTGNHDTPFGGNFNETIWEQYTGHKRLFEFSHQAGSNTDHFIFFGMKDRNVGTVAYSEEDLVWLESKLEQYKNERTFVFMHVFLDGLAGDMNGLYKAYRLTGSLLQRLFTINKKYKNAIIFSGHSHWKWDLQMYDKKANIYRSKSGDTPTSGWTVHCSSCAYPKDSNGSSRVEMPEQSEGAIVDVYENFIDIRGVTFKDEGDADYVTRYLPIAHYRIDTSIQPVV